MPTFDAVFPAYGQACVALFQALFPFAFMVLVIGMALEFWDGAATAEAALKTVIRAFLILVFLLKSSDMINDGQALIKAWVEQNVPARPERVAERYQEKLREAQQLGDKADESFLHQVISGDWYEGIILAVLTLISWLAMVLLAMVYSVQRAVLLGCWALSPLLVPCLAVRPVFGLGLQHVLRLLGIMLWPVGLALAATFTDGLIDVIGSGTSFANAGIGEAVGKGLTGLLGIFVLAVWIAFSTIFAPLYIQRLIAGFGVPTGQLLRSGDLVGSAVAWSYSLARKHFGGDTRAAAPADGPAGYGGGSPAGSSSDAAQEAALTPQLLPPPPSTLATAESASPPGNPADPADPTGDRAAQKIIDRFKPRP